MEFHSATKHARCQPAFELDIMLLIAGACHCPCCCAICCCCCLHLFIAGHAAAVGFAKPAPCTACPGWFTTRGNASTGLGDCVVPIPDADIKEALLRGVEELGADPDEHKRLFGSWVMHADMCLFWRAVDCFNTGGDMDARSGITLNAYFKKPLKGRLPAAWSALGQQLRYLGLAYDLIGLETGNSNTNESCQLVSPFIPETWSNLTHINGLALVNLGLQGTVPVHTFEGMHELSYVWLAHNQFTALPAFTPWKFKHLTHLVLSYNMLGQSTLPELQLGALPALQSMALDHNMLRGKVPASYGTVLRSLVGLTLGFNELDTLDLGQDDYPSLKVLQMDHNKLSGKMPNVVVKNLTIADFSHNSLTALPDVWWHNMPANTTRRYFKILEVLAPHNKIHGSLPPLRSATWPTKLDGRPGSDEPLKLAADLSFNDLSGSIRASAWKVNNTRHGYLIASHNNLTGKLPPTLMHWFGGVVDLSHNMLSGACCPAAWYRWKSLQGLYLQHNMLRGPLPSTYSNWSTLIALDVASNPLSTTIPPMFLGTYPWKGATNQFDGWSVYQEVYLNNCSLFGTLPRAWVNNLLIHGQALAIHDNPNLRGCLPPATCAYISDGNCIKPPVSLATRASSCHSCLSGAPSAVVAYNTLRFDCDEVDRPSYKAHTSCEMLATWPSTTFAAGGACTEGWCAAITGTRVAGTCQP